MLRIINKLCIFMITGLRPLLGPAICKFEIGCTAFAVEQLTRYNLVKASWRIGKRLLACSPLTR